MIAPTVPAGMQQALHRIESLHARFTPTGFTTSRTFTAALTSAGQSLGTQTAQATALPVTHDPALPPAATVRPPGLDLPPVSPAAATAAVAHAPAAPSGHDPASVAIGAAKTMLGKSYTWGGEDPSTSFDCSGLVKWAYAQAGVELPRASYQQVNAGTPVPVDPAQLRPGDLLFSSSRGLPVGHVALYLGEGKVIEATRSGGVVINNVDWDSIVSARRVTPAHATTGQGQGWQSRLPPAATPYLADIQAASARHGIDPALTAALIWAESGFNAHAVSPAGAIGLGQLMPATAASLGVNPHDPAQNIDGTARYAAAQLRAFGSVELMAAAYNAGPSAVARAGGVPGYPETQAYVARVSDLYRKVKGA